MLYDTHVWDEVFSVTTTSSLKYSIAVRRITLKADSDQSKRRDHLRKGNKLAEDKPVVDHLQVGGGGQPLHHTDEDGRHHQHVGQVHCQSGFEVDRLEEGGGKGDHHEEDGG